MLHGRGAVYPAVLAACSVLVGVHALVDFSLEMPAVAATYALLLGVGCAQDDQGRPGRGPTKPRLRPVSRQARATFDSRSFPLARSSLLMYGVITIFNY